MLTINFVQLFGFILILAFLFFIIVYVIWYLPRAERKETGFDTRDISERWVDEEEPFRKWFPKDKIKDN